MQHQKNQSSNSRPVDSPELTSTPYFPAEFRRYPHSNHMQMHRLIILCFLFTSAAAASVAVSDEYDPDQISINCGGASPVTALDGRRWSGDVAAEGSSGSSTASTVKGGLIAAVDSIPYKTARISRSRFSYSFRIDPAPVSHKTDHITSHGNTITNKRAGGASLMEPIEKRNDADDVSPSQADGVILPQPSLTVFTFGQLKGATRNFKPDSLVGEGGFGRVYKGWLDEASSGTTVIAVKRLNAEAFQGYTEWQLEINFLGRLSHPNLVKLLGYCRKDKELLLV